MLAIVGGSGMAELSCLEISRREVVRTPYGEPTGPLIFGTINGQDVVFLSRHGHGHAIPPHLVNYQANIWALNQQQPDCVIAVTAVGGIGADFRPGMLAIPDQIIDYTHSRNSTFFDSNTRPQIYTDFTEPYCAATRSRLLNAAPQLNGLLIDGGVYAATQGPRLETAAEIKRLRNDGAHMVGMTGMPETILARELGMRYATIAVVANYAAGCGDNMQAISLEDAYAVLAEAMGKVSMILEQVVIQDDD